MRVNCGSDSALSGAWCSTTNDGMQAHWLYIYLLLLTVSYISWYSWWKVIRNMWKVWFHSAVLPQPPFVVTKDLWCVCLTFCCFRHFCGQNTLLLWNDKFRQGHKDPRNFGSCHDILGLCEKKMIYEISLSSTFIFSCSVLVQNNKDKEADA